MNSNDMVVQVYGLKVGETVYAPGDKFEPEKTELTERQQRNLIRLGYYRSANRGVVQMAIARRRAGEPWPPRGFTEAYMVEMGWIDAPPAEPTPEEAARPEVKAKVEAKPPKADQISTVELTDDKIPVGPYFLQPVKRGNFVFYSAADAQGNLLRAALFRTTEAGAEFLESFKPEVGDDRDVRTNADEPALEGAPEDR